MLLRLAQHFGGKMGREEEQNQTYERVIFLKPKIAVEVRQNEADIGLPHVGGNWRRHVHYPLYSYKAVFVSSYWEWT